MKKMIKTVIVVLLFGGLLFSLYFVYLNNEEIFDDIEISNPISIPETHNYEKFKSIRDEPVKTTRNYEDIEPIGRARGLNRANKEICDSLCGNLTSIVVNRRCYCK